MPITFSNSDAIIPNKGIGAITLGLSWNELKQLLPSAIEVEQRNNCFVVKLPNIWFFVDDETKKLSQITVLNKFAGKLNGSIGIGSTLKDVIRHLGKFKANESTGYVVPRLPGVSFDLDFPVFESETYNASEKIAYISVFQSQDTE